MAIHPPAKCLLKVACGIVFYNAMVEGIGNIQITGLISCASLGATYKVVVLNKDRNVGAIINYINFTIVNGNSCWIIEVPIANEIPLRIGNRAGANNRGFDGLIDSVKIFDRALGPAEILALSNAESE